MKIYIFSITYNFDGDYVAKKCSTYKEAVKMLNDFLKEEIQTIRTESEYNPCVEQSRKLNSEQIRKG